MGELISADPNQIMVLVKVHEVQQVKALIEQKYGFEPPDQYVADLIAFVDEMNSQRADDV